MPLPYSLIIKTVFKAALVIGMLLLISCKALITPNSTTELYNLRPGNYSVDKSHTRVLFKVDHLGLSTYVGRFNDFDATLSFDPNNLEASRLEATIDTRSLDLNDEKLEYRLAGPTWLNSENYPEAVFTTISASLIDAVNIKFIGSLTLKGKTNPVEMLVTFNGGADNLLSGLYTIGFSATASFKRSEFGIDSYTSIVGDTIMLEVYTEFQKK
jgi:polyisoprenoid-binding protein YceI